MQGTNIYMFASLKNSYQFCHKVANGLTHNNICLIMCKLQNPSPNPCLPPVAVRTTCIIAMKIFEQKNFHNFRIL